MDKKFKLILTMAISAVISIIFFQGYWIWESYTTNQRNFRQTAVNALQNSVNTFILHRIDMPLSLQLNQPYISVMKSISDTNNAGLKDKTKTRSFGKKFDIKFEQVKVTPENIEAARLFMARLSVKDEIKEADISLIKKIFHDELLKNNIPTNFHLWSQKKTNSLPADVITAKLGDNSGQMIAAVFNGNQSFIIRKSLLPGLISLVLILLSTGSLWLMAESVKKQVRFNTLKNEFISNVSHELRTPVSILKSTNEALLNFGEINNPEKTTRYLQINADILDQLDDNIDRLLSIANDLERLVINLETVNVEYLIRKVINRFEHHATIDYQSFLSNPIIKTDSYV